MTVVMNRKQWHSIFKKKLQSPDSNSAQTVVVESAIICYLHAEGARVTRASLVSRDVTMRQVRATSRTGRSTSPAAQIEERKAVAKYPCSKLKAIKLRTAAHSTPRTV